MDYESRRQNRIARLGARADRLTAEGSARFERGRKALDVIPFGQPILAGHHSEKGDRNYRARADNNMRKGFELMQAGEEAARRAEAAESNTAISSDDPEALTKLRAKLVEAERHAEDVAAGIKIVRKVPKPWTAEGLAAAGVCTSVARFCLTMGFAPTSANDRAEVRRIKGRIAELEKRAAAPERPAERYGDIEVSEDREWNRIQIRFPGKPAPEVRAELKAYGFRWAPSAEAWQRQASGNAWHFARQVARAASGVQEPVLVAAAPAAEEV